MGASVIPAGSGWQHPGWLRGLRRSLAATGLALGALALAWLASNGVDAAARPRPAALVWPGVAADNAMALRLAGLRAPADQDPLDAGRQAWQASPDAAVPAGPRTVRPPLAAITGGRLLCEGGEPCAAPWRALSDLALAQALAPALQPHALLAARCAQALASGPFDEPVPAQPKMGQRFGAHVQGAHQCALWFNGQALLAAARGDQAAAVQALAAGEQLSQALVAGSHSLLGHAVVWGLARRQLAVLAEVAVRRPAWAASLQPLAQPWPAPWLQPLRWVPVEVALQQQLSDLARQGCAQPSASLAALDWLACHGVGLLPQATAQLLDARWMARLQAWSTDLPAALARPPAAHGLPWRNTVGHMLLAQDDSAFNGHAARQADVGLLRHAVALALAMSAQGVPAPQRALWLQQQPQPEAWRGRLGLVADGRTLQVRPLVQLLDPAKAAIDLPLP